MNIVILYNQLIAYYNAAFQVACVQPPPPLNRENPGIFFWGEGRLQTEATFQGSLVFI